MSPRNVFVAVAVVGACLVACGDSDDGAVSATELQELNERATEVAASFWGSWPDDAIVDRFADDIAFYDPSDGDFTIEGKAVFVPILEGLLRFWAAAEPAVEEVFVTTDGAAYRVAYPAVVWPPWMQEPREHPPVVFLYVFGITGEAITKYEVSFEDETLEMLGFGCRTNYCSTEHGNSATTSGATTRCTWHSPKRWEQR